MPGILFNNSKSESGGGILFREKMERDKRVNSALDNITTSNTLDRAFKPITQFKPPAPLTQEDEDLYQQGVKSPSAQDERWMQINERKYKERLQREQDEKPAPLKFLENVQSQMKTTLFGDDAQRQEVKRLGIDTSTGNKAADIASNITGSTLGYLMPVSQGSSMLNTTNQLGQMAVNKFLPSSLGKTLPGRLAQRAVEGAVSGAPIGAWEGLTQEKNLQDAAKRMAIDTGLGAVGGAAIQGIGEGISAIKNILKKPIQELATNTQTIKLEPLVKPKTLSGKYEIVNKEYKTALDDYNSAIQEIQNAFGTDQLRVNEVPLIKSKLGIDLDEIIERMSKYESKKLLLDPTELKSKRAYGVADEKQYQLIENLSKKKEVPINSILEEPLTDSKLKLQLFGNDLPPSPTEKLGFEAPSGRVVMESEKPKFNFGDTFKKMYTRMVNNQQPISDIDKIAGTNTHILANNARNAGGTIDYINLNGLVNREGKKIGGSLKEIVEGIPKGKEEDFWEYMLHKHNVSRAAQGKHVYPNYDSAGSAEVTKSFEVNNPEFQEAGKKITKFLNNFMEEWGNKSGLVSDDAWKTMREMYPDYIPTNRDFDEIEKNIVNFGKKGFVDQQSPIKGATGSERDIKNPVENIMNLINRTVKTARYNEVGHGLLNSLRKAPNKLWGFAEIVDPKNVDANLDNIVTVMEGGKPTYIKINNQDLLDAMKGIYNAKLDVVDNMAKKTVNVFKSLITQKNPVFAIRNIARDLPTAYIYGSERNPLKFGADLLSAGKDLVRNTEIAQQYKALGGGGSNFFKADKANQLANELTKKPNVLKRIGEGIETFNNLTESAPRLAEFKRTVKKGGGDYESLQKGLYNAAEVTTNFARHGDITKKLDAYTPYLNAGVQGLDKLARQLDPRNPKQAMETLIKGGVAITAPTMFFHWLNQDNPNYQNLDNRTKDNNYLIPMGDKFIKIPKSRELGVLLGSLFERISRQARGEQDAFKGFFKSGDGLEGFAKGTIGTNFSPANPIEDNILSPLASLKSNKDFADRAIIPENLKDLSPRYQYDEKTSEIAKQLGNIANISPKQIDYLIRSYTGVIGQMGLPMATKSNYNDNWISNLAKPVTTQFVSDPAYSNQSIADFYNNLDKLKTTAADNNLVNDIPSKKVTKEEKERNEFQKASSEMSKINKKIKEIENSNIPDKQERIRMLRQQMIDIANKANQKK